MPSPAQPSDLSKPERIRWGDALCPERWIPNPAMQRLAEDTLDAMRAEHVLLGERGAMTRARLHDSSPLSTAEAKIIQQNFDAVDDTYPGDLPTSIYRRG
jgi:hypothetical protein